ncbi:MAG: ABC transporter permease [Bifidobacteriaceae bacterium]|jgi:ABC-type transport system involved in multi-copper enzyme maturation permease subunit|nr:ABC transporter permease [Bifidobacteriaceae bacterium]
MRKLIALELAKNNIRIYLIAVAVITVVMVGFTYFYASVPYMSNDEEFMDYSSIFVLVSMLITVSFCILSAVMLSKFIVEEYTGNRAILLFSYPVSRRKILAAKLIFVLAFTFVGLIVSSFVTFSIFGAIEHFAPIVHIGVFAEALAQVMKFVLIESLLAMAIAVIALFFGFLKASIPVTIVASIILCALASSLSNLAMNALQPIATVPPMLVAVVSPLLVATLLVVVLMRKVEGMEV